MIGDRIEQMVRIAVAGEKSLQVDDAGRILRPDQYRAADAALDQADPAQDQRAHDALAEISLRDQQRPQLVRRDQERLDIALGMAVDQRDASGQLPDLGEELTRPLLDHGCDMAEPVALGDDDVARQDHEHARPGLAGLEQRLAVSEGADLAKTAHPRDLGRGQRWEGLLKALKHLPVGATAIARLCRCALVRHLNFL